MFASIPRKKSSVVFKLILGLGFSAVVLLGFIGYSYWVSERLYENNTLIEQTDSLVSRLDLLEVKLVACESHVQAYAESGKGFFLNNYDEARKTTRQYLNALETLTAGDAQRSRKVDELSGLVKKRFQLLEKAIAIYKGKAEDKQGLDKRKFQANQLKNSIANTSDELKKMLMDSSAQKKQASHDLLRNNKKAIKATFAVGLVLAGLLILLVYNDVSEREKTEEELRRLNNQKSQFFSIISHDLRGPTRNTRLLLEMMDDPAYASGPDESQQMAALALESARQTELLVEDLLTWGRLQMNQVGIQPTRFKPCESAEKVCGSLQATAQLKNITLENHIPGDLSIQADPNMVETVFRNLVSNAIKFTPEGGNVRLEARRLGEFVELAVADTGVGMPPETMEKIFSFHTKHTTRGTAGEPGTGLGLAVCREFVERNGGTIAVESQVGIGSTFNVRLPVAEEIMS